MDDEESGVVLVNGSSNIYAGIAGEDAPDVIFRNAIAHQKGPVGKDSFVGDEAQQLRGFYSLSYPVQHGLVTDWDAMQRIWEHAFHKLNRQPQDTPCLLADALLNPMGQREKTAQVLFEGLGCPGVTIEDKAKLTCYSYGRNIAVVVNCGEGVTSVWPLYESHLIASAMRRQNFAGGEVTRYLADCLNRQGLAFASSQDIETVREIKEKLCCVPPNPELTHKKLPVYSLPGGSQVKLNQEAVSCGELLFRPSLIGRKEQGIHELVYDTLMECDIDTRRNFYCNILIAGGSTLFKGFQARLDAEMRSLLPPIRMRVVAAEERILSCWIGGSILASLSMHAYVSKALYEEYGPSIIHR